MGTPISKSEYLHTIKKDEAEFLLIGIKKATDDGFDISGCNIGITLVNDFIEKMQYYVVDFFPREVTPENSMEYESLLDDYCVYIDAKTKEVFAAGPS